MWFKSAFLINTSPKSYEGTFNEGTGLGSGSPKSTTFFFPWVKQPRDKDNPQNNFPLTSSGLKKTIHATYFNNQI